MDPSNRLESFSRDVGILHQEVSQKAETIKNRSVMTRLLNSDSPDIDRLLKRVETLSEQLGVLNSLSKTVDNANTVSRNISFADLEKLKGISTIVSVSKPKFSKEFGKFSSQFEEFAAHIQKTPWMRYASGDSLADVNRKINMLINTSRSGAEGCAEKITAIKLGWIKSYMPKQEGELTTEGEYLKNEMEKDPRFTSLVFDEIKGITDENKIREKIEEMATLEVEFGGFMKLLRNTEGPSAVKLSRNYVDQLKDNFFKLNQNLPVEIEKIEDAPPEELVPLSPEMSALAASSSESTEVTGMFRSNLVRDMMGSNSSVNLKKTLMASSRAVEPFNINRIVEFNNELNDPNFLKMTNVFHQGITAEGQMKVGNYHRNQGKMVYKEGSDPDFSVNMFIFKNDKDETIYRYVCIQTVSTELDEDDDPMITDYHLQIVDCKADESGDNALIQRYVSKEFKTSEEARQHFTDLLNYGTQATLYPLQEMPPEGVTG